MPAPIGENVDAAAPRPLTVAANMSEAPRSRRRVPRALASLGVNLCLAAGTLGLCAWALETLARRWALQPQMPASCPSRYSATLGWEKLPGAEARIHEEEYRSFIQINSHGLRGPERGYEKPPGVRRVLLLGDSFAEGYTVDEEATTRAVLEGLLNRQGTGRYEVLNGGTSGYGNAQEYLFFRQEGYRYQPDVVALLFYSNDLRDNVTGGNRPYFDLENGQLVLRNSPVPPLADGDQRVERVKLRDRRFKPWRGSYALRWLSRRTEFGNPRLHRVLARFGLVEPLTGETETATRLFGGYESCSQKNHHEWDVASAILAALRDEVRSRSGQLLLVYVPSRFEVNDAAWQLTRERWRIDDPGWRRDRVFNHLKRVCEALAIPLVDPREALRRAEQSHAPAYLARDGHWTGAGHAIVAQELLAAVSALPARPAPRPD